MFFFFFIRTSVDEMSASCLKDSRPEHELTALRKAVTGGEGKGDAGDTDDLRGVVDFFLLELNITYWEVNIFLL